MQVPTENRLRQVHVGYLDNIIVICYLLVYCTKFVHSFQIYMLIIQSSAGIFYCRTFFFLAISSTEKI